MRVIAVLNQKGGTGKTTISTNMARGLQIMGNEVLLIDSDPQASSFNWWRLKDNHPLDVIPIEKPVIEKSLKRLKKLDYVIIDGAPSNDEMADDAIVSADLILIPVKTSIHDIMASKIVVKKIMQRIKLTDGKLKAAFVINMVIKNTKAIRETEESLSEWELPILNTHVRQRIIYSASAKNGGCVFDGQDNAAIEEINGIIKESLDLLM